MKKNICRVMWLLGVGASFAFAEVSPLESAREKLSPVLDQALAEHCGAACPGYRIEAQKKSASVDDLGFEEAAAPESLKGISVSLLVSEKVTKEARKALQQVIGYRLANVVDLPISVRIHPMSSVTPGPVEKAGSIVSEPLWEKHFAALVWPAALMLLAGLALLGVGLVLRHRSREARAAYERSLPPPPEESVVAVAESTLAVDSLLNNRNRDLAWYLEERAALNDHDSIVRILEAFPADVLSERLKLAPTTVAKLAQLTEAGVARKRSADFAVWLETELDGAHWRRELESTDPIQVVNRLNDERLFQLFGSLRDTPAKALLISAVPQKRWPGILSRMSSNARVEIGLAISKLKDETGASMTGTRAQVLDAVRSLNEVSSSAPVEGLVEDYSLYLSDKEGKQLWQNLSIEMRRKAPKSIEELIASANTEALRALSLSLEWESLRALIGGLDLATRDRLEQALPKSLQERLRASAELRSKGADPEDPNFLLARAKFVGAYRSARLDQ